ncbi:MAG: ABC transporter ATP-binding protein, partial [Firmicutes bacterium]|nr:ABC transporter ATP-binding protein [Bacillota bacterium]
MGEFLRLSGISKQFPGVKALDGVNLAVEPGEIQALLGENGAGKSTLMNILYGLYHADEGEIRLRGKPVRIGSPREAINLGIGMVHQHFMLVPTLTVAENLVLGQGGPLVNLEQARQGARSLAAEYGLAVDPDARIWQLSVGQQQRVEIIKALYKGADILILDEPTAVLTPGEVDQLLEVLKRLTAAGKTIIFITHKLHEVMKVAKRVTVLRLGRVVGDLRTADTTQQELARLMVGRDVVTTFERSRRAEEPEPALAVTDLTALNNRRLPALRGVTLTVRPGEVLGIAGVDGNGQSELAEVIAGLRTPTGGRVEICGKDVTGKSPGPRLSAGLAHIPEDRHRTGLVLSFSVAENLVLHTHWRRPFATRGHLRWNAIAAHARALIQRFDIRAPGPQVPVGQLSGGNQQKVILAREMQDQPQVLMAVHPTRGLDIGATEFVHQEVMAARDRGCAVLLISAELDEILALSDRIAVMYEGRIVGIMNRAEADVQRLGLMMAGAYN